jgi:lambda repressor-like predicted transcriptional regulator
MKKPRKDWDEHAIKAEIRRRGLSMKALTERNGIKPSTLRWAFFKPSPGANRAIAQFLGQPLHRLWPNWFDTSGEIIPVRRRNSTHKSRRDGRAERVAA